MSGGPAAVLEATLRRAAGPLGAFALAALAASGCARGAAPPAAPSDVITFAIEASGATTPLFVQVNGDSDQPGWVTVRNSAGPVHLQTRCDIALCGADPAVCGISIPSVRDIGVGAATHTIETTWDRRTSVEDTALRCQQRLPAPAGEYIARFCHGRNAEAGRVVRPACVERTFTLDDSRVAIRVPASADP